jgi:cobaltochelatase CobS
MEKTFSYSLSLINAAQSVPAMSALRAEGFSMAVAKSLVSAGSGKLDLTPSAADRLRKYFIAAVEAFEPVSAPVEPKAAHQSADDDAEALEALRKLLGKKGMDEERVIELIKAHAGVPATVKINLVTSTKVHVSEGIMHHKFPLLLAAVSAGVNVMLVGPAGSGKTTAAVKAAEALGLAFYGTGAISTEYKLTGFIDAQGRIVSTAFRQAFEHGGVFLFDEMDASLPGALLAFNSALANDFYDFPDCNVARHPDFRPVAGVNTFGTGADRQYVGRNQLDAASLDRWATLVWDYDEALEASFVGAPVPPSAPRPRDVEPLCEAEAQSTAQRFFARVQKVRKAVTDLKIRHVVSPRATINGSKLLAAGWTWKEVEDAVVWKGLDAATVSKVEAALVAA